LAKVISEDKLSKHTMDKYKFKVFSMNAGSNDDSNNNQEKQESREENTQQSSNETSHREVD